MKTLPHPHRRRHLLLAAGASVVLTLAACGSDEPSEQSGATTSTTSTTSQGSVAPLVDSEVGDEIVEGATTWTIHSISRNAECDYGTTGAPDEGSDLIQFRAGVDNEQASDPFRLDPTEIVVGDGTSADWPRDMRDGEVRCTPVSRDDGYLGWGDEVAPGTRAFVNGAFAVPEGTDFMTIRGHRFEIPDDRVDDVPEPDAEEVELDAGTDAPAEQPGSMWGPVGEGYRCPRTDASVWDPADCTPENLGAVAAPDPDPSTVPITDGGTCPAAVCGYGHDEHGNPNPSSGELQTRDGCERGVHH